MRKLKRFLSWFKSPAGGFIGLGLLARIPEWIGLIWHRIGDLLTARDLWTEAGGTLPVLVTWLSSIWFTPVMILTGFVYAFYRWQIEGHQRARAAGIWVDRVGWSFVGLAALALLGTLFFDEFLVESHAPDFAHYVVDQRTPRTFGNDDLARLVAAFQKLDPPLGDIQVEAVDVPEAISYGRYFIYALKKAGQTVNSKGPDTADDFDVPLQARLYGEDHGLLIGVDVKENVKDNVFTPPALALAFKNALQKAGFDSHLTGWDHLSKDQYVFVIGPK